MRLECRMARRRLGAADGATANLGWFAGHYDSCLRCRAEAVRYRRLERELRALAAHEEVAPANLATSVARRVAGPHVVVPRATQPPAPMNRAVAVVGAIAAAAGTAAVVHVMRARSAA